jgi:GTP-binding protein EngB required for normal cell division
MGYPDAERERKFHSDPGESKQRIIMCGQRWSGKTSIIKVVFHKMSANETLFLGQTNKVTCDDINNSIFVQFQLWDVPGIYFLKLINHFQEVANSIGELNSTDRTIDSICSLLKGKGANAPCLIYVIDARVWKKENEEKGNEEGKNVEHVRI